MKPTYDTRPKPCKNFAQCGVTMTFPHRPGETPEAFWRRGSCGRKCQVESAKRNLAVHAGSHGSLR